MQEMLSPDIPEQVQLLINEVTFPTPDDRSPLLRTSSYKEAVVNCERGFFHKLPVENVRAGLQANIRLFIANSSQVFFSLTSSGLILKQVCLLDIIKCDRAS